MLQIFGAGGSCVASIIASILLTFIYVLSLYVWRTNLGRDHPSTIKRRFFSVSCIMLIAPFFTYYFLKQSIQNGSDLYANLGLRWSGLWQASILPLFLTATLFMGPLSMQVLSGYWKIYKEPNFWITNFQDFIWLRNHIVAPVSEEWVFRACMMPLLLQCLDPLPAVFLGPFLFGSAHFHHMFEQIKAGFNIKTALMLSCFQFTYTTLFGAYSAFLFMRTGHFIGPVLAHIFCNHMGFPNFGEVMHYPPVQRSIIIFAFVLGLTLWLYMLFPITSPAIYDNRLNLGT